MGYLPPEEEGPLDFNPDDFGAPLLAKQNPIAPGADLGAPLLSKQNPFAPGDDLGAPLLSKMNSGPTDPNAIPGMSPELLLKASDQANAEKANLAKFGAIGDMLSNQNSFGNFFTGKMNQKSDAVSRFAQGQADSIQDPLQRQAKLYAAYKGMADAKSAQASADAATQDNDPNSKKSIAFRETLKANFPKLAESMGQNFDQITAGDESLVFKPLQLQETINQRKEATAARLQAAHDNNAARADARADKATLAQGDKYQKLRHDLESMRGNQAVQQAAKNGLAADNALKLVEGKDPNSLTPQEIRLFSDELGKIATGGVPGEHGVEALMPNTAASKIAEFKAFFANDPKPAQAGEFIKKNIAYLKDLKGISEGRVNDYRYNIARGYKSLVRPEDMDEAFGDYGLRGYAPSGRKSAESMNAGDGGTTPAAPGGGKSSGRTVVNRQINPKTGQARLVYSDGTVELEKNNVAANQLPDFGSGN